MTDKNPWSRYIDATSRGDLNTAIAEKVRVDPATVGRWRTGAVDPKPRQVVEYARAYSLNPLAALIAAGFITAKEIEMELLIPNTTLADFSTAALADELSRRIHANEPGRNVTSQFPETTDLGNGEPHSTVTNHA